MRRGMGRLGGLAFAGFQEVDRPLRCRSFVPFSAALAGKEKHGDGPRISLFGKKSVNDRYFPLGRKRYPLRGYLRSASLTVTGVREEGECSRPPSCPSPARDKKFFRVLIRPDACLLRSGAAGTGHTTQRFGARAMCATPRTGALHPVCRYGILGRRAGRIFRSADIRWKGGDGMELSPAAIRQAEAEFCRENPVYFVETYWTDIFPWEENGTPYGGNCVPLP